MSPVGLKTHIWNNNFKSLLLLAGFPVLLTAMIWAGQIVLMGFGYLPDTETVAGDVAQSTRMLIATGPLGVLGAGAWFGVAAVSHQGIIDTAFKAKRLSRVDRPDLYNLLENLAISRGMPVPALRIIDSPQLNAFASGLDEDKAVIGVTQGLVDTLTPEELECVLAHELTHIINRDTRLLVIATVFVGIISVAGEVLLRILRHAEPIRKSRRSSKGKAGGGAILMLVAIAVILVAYGLAIVTRAAVSRRREFLADAGAVELTKNPDAMISALRKIAGRAQLETPDEMAAMLFENRETGVGRMMATHPPIEQRIEALVRYAGGREAAEALEPDAFSSSRAAVG